MVVALFAVGVWWLVRWVASYFSHDQLIVHTVRTCVLCYRRNAYIDGRTTRAGNTVSLDSTAIHIYIYIYTRHGWANNCGGMIREGGGTVERGRREWVGDVVDQVGSIRPYGWGYLAPLYRVLLLTLSNLPDRC